MDRLRIAVCQIDTSVGDVDHNVDAILELLDRPEVADVDLLVLPELAVTGAPLRGLAGNRRLAELSRRGVERIAGRLADRVALVGFLDAGNDGAVRPAVAILADGRIAEIVRPEPSTTSQPAPLIRVRGVPVAVLTGVDLDDGRAVLRAAAAGAELVAVTASVPYAEGERARREERMVDLATEAGVAVAVANQVGAQDDLVFEGAGTIVDDSGEILGRSRSFVAETIVADVPVSTHVPGPGSDSGPGSDPDSIESALVAVGSTAPPPERDPVPSKIAEPLERHAELYRAIVTGTRGYLRKNGLDQVVIGLSGGIDSTLVAAIAVDAIGADAVHGVLMPSRFSSDHSVTDALELADNLGIETRTVPIEVGHAALRELLTPAFGHPPDGVADENVQSRLRGVILMALANEFGWIVLTTGNKSEDAVGYSTLYGDTVGGYAPLTDLYKTDVYGLSRWRNTVGGRTVIPERIIEKAPSAELRPDQRDDDSLPSYDVLDPLLHEHVEGGRSAAELVDAGHDPELVTRIVSLVAGAEFKRRQSPMGPRLSTASFGSDRRMPITNGFR